MCIRDSSDDPSIGIDTQNDSSKPVVINGFDVTDFGRNNYMIGDIKAIYHYRLRTDVYKRQFPDCTMLP